MEVRVIEIVRVMLMLPDEDEFRMALQTLMARELTGTGNTACRVKRGGVVRCKVRWEELQKLEKEKGCGMHQDVHRSFLT
jgi:hypothetical protein